MRCHTDWHSVGLRSQARSSQMYVVYPLMFPGSYVDRLSAPPSLPSSLWTKSESSFAIFRTHSTRSLPSTGVQLTSINCKTTNGCLYKIRFIQNLATCALCTPRSRIPFPVCINALSLYSLNQRQILARFLRGRVSATAFPELEERRACVQVRDRT